MPGRDGVNRDRSSRTLPCCITAPRCFRWALPAILLGPIGLSSLLPLREGCSEFSLDEEVVLVIEAAVIPCPHWQDEAARDGGLLQDKGDANGKVETIYPVRRVSE